jgi:hypothetical protein
VEVEEEGMNNGFRVANGLECVVGKWWLISSIRHPSIPFHYKNASTTGPPRLAKIKKERKNCNKTELSYMHLYYLVGNGYHPSILTRVHMYKVSQQTTALECNMHLCCFVSLIILLQNAFKCNPPVTQYGIVKNKQHEWMNVNYRIINYIVFV